MTYAKWPQFSEEEIAAVVAVLRSGTVNYWTGQEGIRFEREFAAYCGCRFGIAVTNGTLALELALRALGIGPGDEVITPARGFIASASCIVTVGAKPVFADIDRDSQNVTAETIRPKIGSRTRAVIAVHLNGWPCDMDPILALAAKHGLKVIEDCAQAHGARYKGRPVGSMGHVGAFSFCQDKIITTGGEGGMLITSDGQLWSTAWAYKDHGKSVDALIQREQPSGHRWPHETPGTNARMTEMQAAIGRVALRQLDDRVCARRRNAALWDDAMANLPAVRPTTPPESAYHACYRYSLVVRPESLLPGWSRDRILSEVLAAGVPGSAGACGEIYREPAFQTICRGIEPLPNAAELSTTTLAFPVHPTLCEEETRAMIAVVRSVFETASCTGTSR